jgi:hypothetical protein
MSKESARPVVEVEAAPTGRQDSLWHHVRPSAARIGRWMLLHGLALGVVKEVKEARLEEWAVAGGRNLTRTHDPPPGTRGPSTGIRS